MGLATGALGAAIGAALTAPAQAALVLNTLADYSNSFDAPFLAAANADNPWADDGPIIGVDGSGSPGWFWQNAATPLTYEAGSAFPNAVRPYSLGDGDDRAMGNYGGPANPYTAWGVVFQNGTSQTIDSVTIAYFGEQWNRGSEPDTLRFSVATSNTPIVDFNAAGGAAPAGWTAVPELTFTTPVTTGPVLVDGNTARTSLATTIAASVPPGSFLALRWYDGDDSGTDAAMAVDDLQVQFFAAAPVPEITAAALVGAAGLAGAAVRWARRRRAAHRVATGR